MSSPISTTTCMLRITTSTILNATCRKLLLFDTPSSLTCPTLFRANCTSLTHHTSYTCEKNCTSVAFRARETTKCVVLCSFMVTNCNISVWLPIVSVYICWYLQSCPPILGTNDSLNIYFWHESGVVRWEGEGHNDGLPHSCNAWIAGMRLRLRMNQIVATRGMLVSTQNKKPMLSLIDSCWCPNISHNILEMHFCNHFQIMTTQHLHIKGFHA